MAGETGYATTSYGGSGASASAVTGVGAGLTLLAGVVTNDLITGKAGGQTITGGTGNSDTLTLKATSSVTPDTVSAVIIRRDSANTSSRPTMLAFQHMTSGATALGFGSSILWQGEDSAGNLQDYAAIDSYLSVVTDGAESAAIGFRCIDAGVMQTGFNFTLSLFGTGASIVGQNTVNNTTLNVLSLRKRVVNAAGVSQVGANGVGVGAVWDAPSSTGSIRAAVNTRAVLTDATNGAEDAEFRLGLRVAGANPAEGAEQFQFSKRGLGVSLGGLATTVAAKTGSYTLTDADSAVFVDSTSGANTQTLPTPVGRAGRVFVIKRVNDGPAVTIATAAGTIDGATTVVMTNKGEYRAVQSDGTNWHVISGRNNYDEMLLLGAAATSISFDDMTGVDEVEILGWILGAADNYMHATVNNAVTNLAYQSIQTDGAFGHTTAARIANVNTGGHTLCQLRMNIAVQAGLHRMGFAKSGNRTSGAAWNQYLRSNVCYADATTPIAAVGLEIDTALGFAAGSIFFCNRKRRAA